MDKQQDSGEGKGKRMVVIGGGVAGSLIAKTLQFNADLTLIDPKEYFEITWASLRSMVEPSFANRSVINHKDYLTNGRIVTSAAINITGNEVLTAEGRAIPYDYLVIATGHKEDFAKTKKERLSHYEAEYEKIESASSILIVGGGPTGVELAGEIAVDFPAKKVTLVHKGPRLLEFIGPKAGDKALDWLVSKKVDVLLDQSVDLNSTSNGGTTYVTSGGQSITADSHFLCTGKPLSSEWLKESVLRDSVDKRGRLMVDEYLRVKGRNNIFAIGDITDIPWTASLCVSVRELTEGKQGYLAQKHASVAAKNLKLVMNGGNENKLRRYEPASSALAIVSLGRKAGVAQFPFTTIIGRLPGMIKSKDLFVGKTRKQMGLNPNVVDS